MTSIAIKGSWVVGWGENGHHVIEDGVVVTEDDRIAFVGSQGDPDCPPADRVIDATGMLVSPGLINLHAIANLDLQVLHIDGPDDANFPKAESFIMDPTEPFILTDEEYRVSADFSVATLLKSGCTTFANVTTSASKRWEDTRVEPYALAEASERMGARGWIGHFYMEGCTYTDASGQTQWVWDSKKGHQAMDNGIELVKYLQKRGHPLVTGFLFPVRTDSCSEDMLKETVRQAKLLGDVHIRAHFAQRIAEFRLFKSKNPHRSMVEWLQDIGFLGPQICLTHAVYIAGHSATGDPPGNDLQILAESGTNACCCPVVSARGGKALESFSRYVAAGVNMGIGTDTFPPDLLEEMRFGALVNKVVEGSRGAGTVLDFYNAATIGGAKALRRDDLGRLAPGCTADISIFDFSGLYHAPIDDPMRTLVHIATGKNCHTVLVGGKVVVDAGRVVGLDEEELEKKARDAWLKYKSGVVAWDAAKRPSDVIFPPLLPTAGH